MKSLYLLFAATIICVTTVAAEPLQIGMSLDLSGHYRKICRSVEQALHLWQSDVNRTGGIRGRKVRLKIFDDGGSTATARNLYRQMAGDPGYDFLFPPYSSALTLAVLPITEQRHFPLLTYGAAADSLWQHDYRHVFGVLPPASRYSLGFLELALTNGLKRIAIVSTDDPFGMDIAKGAENWGRRLGLEVTERIIISEGVSDYTQLADTLRDSRSDAVLMCGHLVEAVELRRALARSGWQPRAYWASAGPTVEDYRKDLGPLSDGTFSATTWKNYPKLPYPGAKEFDRDFTNRYGTPPSYQAAAAYASATLLQRAIEAAGSFDRDRVRDQLVVMDVVTLLGRYSVDASGMQLRALPLTVQWQDGVLQVVWPRKLSTAAARLGRP